MWDFVGPTGDHVDPIEDRVGHTEAALSRIGDYVGPTVDHVGPIGDHVWVHLGS